MDISVVATGLSFPEGPAISPSGQLHWTEIAGQRIARLEPDGTVGTFAATGVGLLLLLGFLLDMPASIDVALVLALLAAVAVAALTR